MSKNKNSASGNNSSGGEGDDDARKKRGNSQDERETSKKVRSAEHERKNNQDVKCDVGGGGDDLSNAHVETGVEDNSMADKSQRKDAGRSDDRAPKITSGHNNYHTEDRKPEDRAKQERQQQQQQQRDQVWDLESALLYLVQIGSTGDNNSKSEHQRKDKRISKNPDTTEDVEDIDHVNKTEEIEDLETDASKTTMKDIGSVLLAKSDGSSSSLVQEYLTHEENSWITFRTAHAGDASTIAQWYRKQRSENHQNCRRRQNQGVSLLSSSSSSSSSNNNNYKNGKETNETTEEEVQREPEEPEINKHPLRPSSSNEEEVISERNQHNTNTNKTNTINNNTINENNKDNENDSNDAATDEEEDKLPSSSLKLEHWLAEGLGDENTCPFVHGLLAYVHRSPKKGTGETTKIDENDDGSLTRSPMVAILPPPSTVPSVLNNTSANKNDKEEMHPSGQHHLAAVVLLSLSWAFGKRNLRIEWMSVDSSVLSSRSRDEGLALRQKVWLRIHTLSAMTACQAISVDEDVLLSASEKEQASPSNGEHDEEEEPLDGAGSNTKAASPKNHRAPVARNNQVEPSAE
jgi:hypothetical protein